MGEKGFPKEKMWEWINMGLIIPEFMGSLDPLELGLNSRIGQASLGTKGNVMRQQIIRKGWGEKEVERV